MTATWTPLLRGGAARRARACLKLITKGLAHLRPETPSYATGSAGLALFFGYLAADLQNEAALELATEHLCQAAEGVDQDNLGLSLHNGLIGIAWTMRHLEGIFHPEVSPDLTVEVDELLLRALEQHPWRHGVDLTYGLAGLGVYALDHSQPQLRRDLLAGVLFHLQKLSIESPEGVAWPALGQRQDQELPKHHPAGLYDLGLAHGVPGIIAMLARTVLQGQGGSLARELLAGSTHWLLRQRRERDDGSIFPYSLPEGRSARSAWCYGDPGVAASLLSAARALGSPAMEAQAIAIANYDRRRSRRQSGVVDAGLCHGAAGLGHLYNRLYQSTGHLGFANTARDWLARSLSLRKPGLGIAGFASYWPQSGTWHNQPGLLDGTTGVGLALLAATSAIEPAWDHPLLISTPLPEPGGSSAERESAQAVHPPT